MMIKQRPIESSRSCPVCDHPVPWDRYWLRSWGWAKWPCPRCGSVLTFDKKRRAILSLCVVYSVFFATCLGYEWGWGRIPTLTFWCLIGVMLIHLLARVTVRSNRSTRFCQYCQYDLQGTIESGSNRRPECGEPFEYSSQANP
jgi:CXXC-20-CXXC protein